MEPHINQDRPRPINIFKKIFQFTISESKGGRTRATVHRELNPRHNCLIINNTKRESLPPALLIQKSSTIVSKTRNIKHLDPRDRLTSANSRFKRKYGWKDDVFRYRFWRDVSKIFIWFSFATTDKDCANNFLCNFSLHLVIGEG